jgi:hypothetical protein
LFRSLSKTKTTAEHGMSHQTRWSGTHNNVTRAGTLLLLMRQVAIGYAASRFGSELLATT